MIPIIIQSDDPECRLSHFLWNLLRPFHTAALVSKESILCHCPSPDFLIAEGDFSQMQLSSWTIAIYTGNSSHPPVIPQQGVAIVATACPFICKTIAASGIPAITCGLSPKDTLTLSSRTSDSLMISLQRTMSSISGYSIDPVEIPLSLSCPRNPLLVLPAAAVLLLLDHLADFSMLKL